jgi:transcriptional regulator with XRE-family HTH domain
MKYDAYEIGLRAYNMRQGLSKKQSEISDILGISQATYSRFETGQGELPLSKVIKLCDYLGVSVSWLIGEKSLPQLTDSERLELEKYKNFLISSRNK